MQCSLPGATGTSLKEGVGVEACKQEDRGTEHMALPG